MFSFKAAREKLLQDFEFKAVVRMESTTFGKTGQPTVIMFLKKNDEPPKRYEMVQDTVDAIFNGRRLEDWEDREIFELYLKRIECRENDYYDVIQKRLSWDELLDLDSFAEYVMVFMEESVYRDMSEKLIAGKIDETDFNTWRLGAIYEKIDSVEREKIKYFALTYKQRTLFVNMPYLIDMEGDSYRLRETLRNNGTDFETVVK